MFEECQKAKRLILFHQTG